MKRYYLIDHKLLFLFGYIFYLLMPYVVGVNELFPRFPGMQLFHSFFRAIPEVKLSQYLVITLSWLPAFFLGHLTFNILYPIKKEISTFNHTAVVQAINPFGILLVLVLMLFIFLSRNSLFAGYNSYDIGARGKMSSLLVIFNFFLLYQLLGKGKASIWIILGTCLTALLLLSMGGRMYVFQTLIILMLYKTSFASRRWSIGHVLSFFLIGLIIASIFGLWRMGSSVTTAKALYSIFAEPAFTWFSTSTFLSLNEIPPINMPWNFLTSFLNLVPNTLFSLQPYIVSAKSMGYSYENPLGAESVWSTYIINFGTYGSFVFVFITGFILNMLRKMSERSHFAAVYYLLVCSVLPFQFFRDGFYILNKQLFFNFLLLPGIVLIGMHTVIYLQRSARSSHLINPDN